MLMLPCADQASTFSAPQRAAYDYILSEADEAVILSDTYHRGCMQKRNRALVENADMLICYVGRESGGSAQTMRLAREKGIAVHNLYPHI